jgi:GTPase SAR1 family protein
METLLPKHRRYDIQLKIHIERILYALVIFLYVDAIVCIKIHDIISVYLSGLVYVVDSNDRERIAESREELFGILQNDEMRGVPVMVIANKQDLPSTYDQ